jgi:YD repeat-containing protein
MADPKGNVWAYTYTPAGLAKDPDKGTTSKTYDLAGQVTSTTDARGATLRHSSDQLGRLTQTADAAGNPLVKNSYDTVMKGHLASSARQISGQWLASRADAYDGAGRPTQQTTVVPQITGLVGRGVARFQLHDRLGATLRRQDAKLFGQQGRIRQRHLPAGAVEHDREPDE